MPTDATRARPSGFWGWTVCLGHVAAWVGGNAWVGSKIATLVKKWGSIKKVILKAKAAYNRAPRNQKAHQLRLALGAVGGEIIVANGIVENCFQK